MFKITSTSKNYLIINMLKQSLLLNKRAILGINNRTHILYFSTQKHQNSFIHNLKAGKYYQVLGFSSSTMTSPLTDSQLKRQYLGMIKKYHSDNVIDLDQKLQNQQITKCIISAYERIVQERIKSKVDQGSYQNIYKDEDEVSMKLFGKRFNAMKFQIFKQGNTEQKNMFIYQLQQIRKRSKNYQYQSKQQQRVYRRSEHAYHQNYSPSYQEISMTFSHKFFLCLICSAVPLIILYELNYQNKNSLEREERNKSKLRLSDEQKKQIQKKSMELYEKKLNDLIQSFQNEQPPSLKLSNIKDPDQMEQLLQLTIAPDIHLYEIPAQLLAQRNLLQKMMKVKKYDQILEIKQNFSIFELSKIKTNSTISLSLQAERCLQNIYIKVKDVAEEIEQTGKYTPPFVFFKFYGYIMFSLRQKPLSMLNYRDTEYISLFELFFDYYSPIPVKRHEFNEYVVGFDNNNETEERMFGQVHLNHRKIPERFITKEDKIVVMRDDISQNQIKYSDIWNGFYAKYMKVWKKQTSGRIKTQFSMD